MAKGWGDGNVGYGDASRQGQEDVPAGFDPGAGIRGRGAIAPCEAREAAEGGFLGGGDACPVHDTAQNPFQDVMEQRGMCSEGRAPHSVVSLGGGRVAPQSHCTAGALEGSMLRPRRWRRPVRTSPLLSSRAQVQGRVSSQAEAVGRSSCAGARARVPFPCALLAS
jgi:hypothetical protein